MGRRSVANWVMRGIVLGGIAAISACWPKAPAKSAIQDSLPVADPTRPWVVGDVALSQHLEILRHRGLVVVSYDESSAEKTLTVLEDCIVPGFKYHEVFAPTPGWYKMSSVSSLEGKVDFINFAALKGQARSEQSLLMTTNGRRSASLPDTQLLKLPSSPACGAATHFVTGLILGSWAWYDQDHIEAIIHGSVASSGGSFGRGSGQGTGDPARCIRANLRDNQDRNCMAVVAVELFDPKRGTEAFKVALAVPGTGDFVSTFASRFGVTQQVATESLHPVLEARRRAVLPPTAQPVQLVSGNSSVGGALSGQPATDSFLMAPGWCYAVLASGGPSVKALTVDVSFPGGGESGRDGERTAGVGHRGRCLMVPPLLGPQIPLPLPALVTVRSATPGAVAAQVFAWPAR
jgi:hypothetical protein